jgi:hypothetical protein
MTKEPLILTAIVRNTLTEISGLKVDLLPELLDLCFITSVFPFQGIA